MASRQLARTQITYVVPLGADPHHPGTRLARSPIRSPCETCNRRADPTGHTHASKRTPRTQPGVVFRRSETSFTDIGSAIVGSRTREG